MKAKVFISYSSKDINKLKALKMALKNRDNIKPLIVADRRSPGSSLTSKVKKCMKEANCLMPILTRKSIQNQWVNQEIGYAECKGMTIIPLVEEGILGKLKGFLHPQVDLPFTFKGNKKNPRKESRSFRQIYTAAFDFIATSDSIKPKRITKPRILKITAPRKTYVTDKYVKIAGANAKRGSSVIVLTSLYGKYLAPQKGRVIADSNGDWEHARCHLLHLDKERLIYALAVKAKDEEIVRGLVDKLRKKPQDSIMDVFQEVLKKRKIPFQVSEGKRLIRKS